MLYKTNRLATLQLSFTQSRKFTAPSYIAPRCRDIAALLWRQSKSNTLLCLNLLTFKSLGREAGQYFCLVLSSEDYKVRRAHIKQQSNPWCALRRALLTPDQYWLCGIADWFQCPRTRVKDSQGSDGRKNEKQILISAF